MASKYLISSCKYNFRSRLILNDITNVSPILNISTFQEQSGVAKDEYYFDIIQHLNLKESKSQICDYLLLQPELSMDSRQYLLTWVVKAHLAYNMDTNVLFNTISIIDSVLSIETVMYNELQILAMAALMIASKMEETQPLSAVNIMCLVPKYCTRRDLMHAETNIMLLLQNNAYLSHSLSYYELMTGDLTQYGENFDYMCKYLLELLLFDYRGQVTFRPSLQAMTAVMNAMLVVNDLEWTPPCEFNIGKEELAVCGSYLQGLFMSAQGIKNHPIRMKYSTARMNGVATMYGSQV